MRLSGIVLSQNKGCGLAEPIIDEINDMCTLYKSPVDFTATTVVQEDLAIGDRALITQSKSYQSGSCVRKRFNRVKVFDNKIHNSISTLAFANDFANAVDCSCQG